MGLEKSQTFFKKKSHIHVSQSEETSTQLGFQVDACGKPYK